MTDDYLQPFLDAYRLIWVAFCGRCICSEDGFCYRHMRAVTPTDRHECYTDPPAGLFVGGE